MHYAMPVVEVASSKPPVRDSTTARRVCVGVVAFLILLSLVPAEFAIRDGDTVVFLGDSITAARQYGKIIETYTLLRFPERKVRFINAGKGGETAKEVSSAWRKMFSGREQRWSPWPTG